MPMDIGADKPGQGHAPEALADARRIQAIWREALAASGGPFLFGAFTIADAMFAPVTTRFVTYGVDARRHVPRVRRRGRGAAGDAGVVRDAEREPPTRA